MADLGLSLDELPIDKLILRLIDLVDSHHLPILAQSMSVAGVDGYWLAESDEARRNLIKGAYDLHRYKGTPWAVKEIVRRLGFGNATLEEGFGGKRHNGEIIRRDGVYNYGHSDRWAYYRIIIHEPITLEQANLLRKTLSAFAPARCILSALDFTQASIRHNGKIVRDGRYTRGTA